MKELGTHILVCAVSYVGPTGENLYFRKFFKFQVLKPLDVKTKFYNADSDDVYLEAQVPPVRKRRCGHIDVSVNHRKKFCFEGKLLS